MLLATATPGFAAVIEGTADPTVIYRQSCASCHGADLHGAAGPALSGPGFEARWTGKANALRALIANTMPLDAPGSLPPMAYNSLTGFLLSQGATAESIADTQPSENAATNPPPSAPRLPAEPKHFNAPSSDGPNDHELLNSSDGDWLSYNRDYRGQRFSPLKLITPENVAHLAPKCIFQLGEIGSFQASPVIRAGRLYVTTAHRTYALDAATCKRLWVHEYTPSGVVYEYMPTNRGVALYKGTVIRGTLDGHLIALDAMTGDVVWDTWVADSARGYFLSAAPLIFDGKLYIGEAGADYGASGHVRAFDAATGRALWKFNVIPSDNENGRESWPKTGERGGGSMWTTISVDPATRSLYASTGNPYLDFDGSERPGDNLYTDSVIVLDADSGKLKWYVQQIPHDVRDWDTAAAPVLYAAQGRNMMAVGSKGAQLFLYDRDRRTLIARRDLIERQNATGVLPPGIPTHVCPGGLGGVEWNGPAFDPSTGLVFVNTDDWCMTLTPQKLGDFMPAGGIPALDPADKARGWLRAFDAVTGDERWYYHADSPMLAGITPTASGLLLTGTGAGEFLAFDAKSGRQLYSFNTGGALAGGISTYSVGDRQYVAVASGNSSKSLWQNSGAPMIIVFGLP
jgi:alcohol dehydrogenase (cytochrome c)